MSKADIGLIGLGVMGANLALNIAEKGHKIADCHATTRDMLQGYGTFKGYGKDNDKGSDDNVSVIVIPLSPRSVLV